ncbi:sulfatase-like hydrolase/transferase [uncultured Roseovarius sp.]|uniref:sulfatase-like hydrolase/transferase n=1 Tax=uncultured Roseovarius sp. TaxID=293344 RepID=UPI0026230D54|nr:sulfatase-like hydrolase/transferase [uncultured Roseovarius sp.]
MQTVSQNVNTRPLGALSRIKYNLFIAVFCIATITLMDLAYYQFVNSNYVFKVSSLFQISYLFTCVLIFAATFAGKIFYRSFITIIFAMSVFQIINFEYFGSYILPIHYIQLAPDFLLIMSSLFEATGEMIPVLLMAGVVVVLIIAVLVPMSRHRIVVTRAAWFVVIILGCDFAGNYMFISVNKEKLGEPSYLRLFPDINRLGVDNAYRSARYLTVGILPDKLSGKSPDYPALPEPVALSSPDVNIIVILNETVRAESLSVLGYERKTTPRLDQIEDLYASSIYSSGTMTRTSFAGLINRLKYPGIGTQFLSQSNCLFRLAKKNGFKTHFHYSHDRDVADTLLPLMSSKSIDSIRVSTDAPPEMRSFDDSLAYHLEQIDYDDRNFIVIGPSGAHSPYAEKSPEAFKKFGDEYHNAIHYTDHVVGGLIEQLRQHSTKPTYVMMTSDHGELLKGEGMRRGHGWFKNEVFNVPFLFLPINAPDPADTMSEVRKVQSHFDMATLVLRLMGYDLAVQDASEKEIFINGSDLSGLAGQLRLEFQDHELQSVELINGMGTAPDLDEVRIDRMRPGSPDVTGSLAATSNAFDRPTASSQ